MIYTIYTQGLCGYCDAAKKLMKENSIPFVEVSLDHDYDARKMLKEMDCKTVPQIFDGELHIGGYTDLREYLIKPHDHKYRNPNQTSVFD